MSEAEFDTSLDQAERASDEPALLVDVEGFEGPLDLLLMLARQQKVDLAKISVLALAEQYLAYIDAARKLRLELAADYLVMAAWLAYLKSRLLLPDQEVPEGTPSAEELALALANRLKRLEAFRKVAEVKSPEWSATLYDLLTAYTTQRQHSALARVRFAKRTVWSLAEARAALERLIGQSGDWSRVDQFLIRYLVEPSMAATVFASSFASALELVREGVAEIHQKQAFAPLFMRKRVGMGAGERVAGDLPMRVVEGNA